MCLFLDAGIYLEVHMHLSIDAGSRNTGWLYDLSSEIWKGYTATRFYRCRSACASIYGCGHLFIRASIYLLIDAGAYKYTSVHLFIDAGIYL